MGIMLGNMTTAQIQKRAEIQLTEQEFKDMEDCRQDNAQSIAPDKWHCFDIPFTIVCGSMATAVKIHDILKKYSDRMKGTIEIAINEEGK